MKHIFLIVTLLLTVATTLTYMARREAVSDVPVLYWSVAANPTRMEMAQLFRRWLKQNGYADVDLRVEASSLDPAKKIIQGVSGVAGDVFDVPYGAMNYFNILGLLEDVTKVAEKDGFSPAQTWPSLRSDIVATDAEGQERQFAYPANLGIGVYFVNQAAFRELGLEGPRKDWTVEDFERVGKAYVQAANQGGGSRKFFANTFSPIIIRRGLGLSEFNETMTRCTLDDPRNAKAMELIHRWTYEDKLLPDASEKAAYTAEGAGGGLDGQMFVNGLYPLMYHGRYIVIFLRENNLLRKAKGLGPMEITAVYPPNCGYPNALAGCRTGGVYAGSKHKELAERFLEFLASEDYNKFIIKSGDTLPPNPKYARTVEMLRPAEYPEEWGIHEVFVEAAETMAHGTSYSPFVLQPVVLREDTAAFDGYMAGLYTAPEAAKRVAGILNKEIARTIEESPELKPLYEELTERQKAIDERRAAGMKVPLAWITNPFYQKYYQTMGWAE